MAFGVLSCNVADFEISGGGRGERGGVGGWPMKL